MTECSCFSTISLSHSLAHLCYLGHVDALFRQPGWHVSFRGVSGKTLNVWSGGRPDVGVRADISMQGALVAIGIQAMESSDGSLLLGNGAQFGHAGGLFFSAGGRHSCAQSEVLRLKEAFLFLRSGFIADLHSNRYTVTHKHMNTLTETSQVDFSKPTCCPLKA